MTGCSRKMGAEREAISLEFRGSRYARARVARRWSLARIKWDGFNSGVSAESRLIRF